MKSAANLTATSTDTYTYSYSYSYTKVLCPYSHSIIPYLGREQRMARLHMVAESPSFILCILQTSILQVPGNSKLIAMIGRQSLLEQ
jgi:hypothetical protein